MTKITKFSKISKLLYIFSKLSTHFVDWNSSKGQQRRTVLFSRLFGRVFAVFPEKMSQIDTENDKKDKIFLNFKVFMHFFDEVSTDFVDWNFLKGQQETNGLSSSPFEEIIALF